MYKGKVGEKGNNLVKISHKFNVSQWTGKELESQLEHN